MSPGTPSAEPEETPAFLVDPLCCRRCGAEMMVIAVITAPALIDRLLCHVRGKAEQQGKDPFDARAPPGA